MIAISFTHEAIPLTYKIVEFVFMAAAHRIRRIINQFANAHSKKDIYRWIIFRIKFFF